MNKKVQKAVIELKKQHVDLRSMQPREELIAAVAERVVRKGREEIPGFAVIPNTKDLLSYRVNERIFQLKLMESFERYLEETNTRALSRQRYSLVKLKNPPGYRKTKRRVDQFDFRAYFRETDMHTDLIDRIYVSLCYSKTVNVHGGTFRFIDLLPMARRYKVELSDLIYPVRNLFRQGEYGRDSHYCKPKEGLDRVSKPYEISFEGIDPGENPLVIFSNRLEDGLIHGATKVAKRNSEVDTLARSISYCTIEYV